ncbi:MAG: hypothetical protein Q9P14_09975 [candidate division KSB1 bacterium]|nr:hypothetical protein [candidate division KSB1 bacterium]MDQ7063588.1 hypothetical protein [candidate division KSB1 bacterium]
MFPLDKQTAIIGDVTADKPGQVSMLTRIGSWRMVDRIVGEQLPRIC